MRIEMRWNAFDKPSKVMNSKLLLSLKTKDEDILMTIMNKNWSWEEIQENIRAEGEKQMKIRS